MEIRVARVTSTVLTCRRDQSFSLRRAYVVEIGGLLVVVMQYDGMACESRLLLSAGVARYYGSGLGNWSQPERIITVYSLLLGAHAGWRRDRSRQCRENYR